ncbi:ABC transporter ATP-binding protein [Jannaschia formosa]|uniref:ABC transporter ATP-binding protein n=1 Tax=Jannaschia formosa TaxID=2259592 RepID=UPI000E1C1E1E|nr:ABC transporter ATP-binding protein [Jannaschia formosa]TFL17605.1 ABC transporter ATP-binding protein [Jannaschia formosa]
MSRPDHLSETLPGLGRVLRRLAPYLRGHRLVLTGAVLALILSTLAKLAEPWALKFVIDTVVPSASGDPALAGWEPMTVLTLCAVGLLAAVMLRAMFEFLATMGFALVGNRVLTRVRADLFRHLQSLSLGFHTRSRAGDLTMRLVGDVGMLKEVMVTAAMPLAANVLIFAGMVGVMVWLDWRLALVALAPLPVLVLVSRLMTGRIREVSRTQRKRQGHLASTSTETLAGIRSIQALGLEARAAQAFGGANDGDMKAGIRGARLAASLERSVDVLAGLGLAAILFFGTRQVLAGRITPGDLLIFVTYLKHTFRPVRAYAKYAARLAKALAAGERVVALLDEEDAVRDRPWLPPAPALTGSLAFEGVSFAHPGGAPVLHRLDLRLAAGKRVALVGPSGGGKSTLAGLVLRLYDPGAGRVTADGIDLRHMTLASLRAQVSLVPQEPLIVSGTVRENLTLGLAHEVSDAEIRAAARAAAAHDFIAAMPGGYDAEVAERGGSLSAGQRQRLSLARALLRRAPILVLDEPTTGLDEKSAAMVAEAIGAVSEGRTTLLITHDLALAAACDRVVVLDGGRIVEAGRPARLLQAGGWFAAAHARQRGERPHALAC